LQVTIVSRSSKVMTPFDMLSSMLVGCHILLLSLRDDASASSGSARCSFKASGAGADIHISISSGLVRMTGMAFA
jgi:hypothetical protein